MSATVIDGRVVAAKVLDEVRERAERLHARDIRPVLAFVLIGQSRPAELYARRLTRLAGPIGVDVRQIALPDRTSPEDLTRVVLDLSLDVEIDGILVQLPLPDHLTGVDLGDLIDPRKDVDGITVENAGRLYLELPGQFPSTALAMMELFASTGIEAAGADAVVVGRSKIVGHPAAELLLRRDATVSVTHRQTRDLRRYTSQADILLVAAGEPGLITAEMVKPGAVVIDAGINLAGEGVVGDVDFDAVSAVAGAITPVPGGVGPVTNAVLLRNLIASSERRHA